MRKKEVRRLPEEKSRATIKRKHTHFEQNHFNKQTKRQKWVSSETETKTLTLKPQPLPNLPISNRFQAVRPCSSSSSLSRRHENRQKRSKSSFSGDNRKWIFSSYDCSNYIGIRFSTIDV